MAGIRFIDISFVTGGQVFGRRWEPAGLAERALKVSIRPKKPRLILKEMTSWLIISRRQRQLGDEGGKFWSKKESLVKGKEREAKFWRKGPLHEVYNMEEKRERYRQQWRDRVNKLALLAKYDERRLQQYTAKSIERYCWIKSKIYLGNIFYQLAISW